jgi:phospholipid/cholesterol/gamma-HCH transport system substrate-binding protein
MVAVALLILMAIVFLIGSEQKIFARKNEYEVQLDSVSGLAEGNPVRLSGVTIGVVKDITLPSDPNKRNVRIELMIDRKYAERIRGDSRARLKKMGLLAGDSYIDITPGSPRFPALDPGALIPAQRQTNVDQLIASGEDLVDNLVQLSYSMKNILGRVDRGEGLIGELTTNSETKQRITETLLTTLNKTNALLAHVESGKGLVGKLVYDDAYAQQLTASVSGAAANLQTVTGSVQKSLETGNGMLPALLNDPTGKKKVFDLVDNLNTTSRNLAEFSTSLQTGQGLVPRLLNDKAYGDQALGEFTSLLVQLNDTVKKINAGQGTAGKLIADPSVYESVNDILIGINESKLLRWLIRNRQQKGIEKRYATEQSTTPPATGATPTTVVPPAPAPDKPPPDKSAPDVVNPAPVTETAPPATTTATTTSPPPAS